MHSDIVVWVTGEMLGVFEYASNDTLRAYLRQLDKGKIRVGNYEGTPSVSDLRDHLLGLALDVANGMRHLASRGVSTPNSILALQKTWQCWGAFINYMINI